MRGIPGGSLFRPPRGGGGGFDAVNNSLGTGFTREGPLLYEAAYEGAAALQDWDDDGFYSTIAQSSANRIGIYGRFMSGADRESASQVSLSQAVGSTIEYVGMFGVETGASLSNLTDDNGLVGVGLFEGVNPTVNNLSWHKTTSRGCVVVGVDKSGDIVIITATNALVTVTDTTQNYTAGDWVQVYIKYTKQTFPNSTAQVIVNGVTFNEVGTVPNLLTAHGAGRGPLGGGAAAPLSIAAGGAWRIKGLAVLT